MTTEFKYDIVVVGAGHAGCEAAHAAAKMGAKTCLITMDVEKIAQMSCNPAIGGIAKGQIVREIDALGGLTGIITDRSTLQFRMLNQSKGPAMWSPRAQCDRTQFSIEWRKELENTTNLHIWQDQVDELLVKDNQVCGVHTIWDVKLYAKCVIITAGTFLNGLMHIGHKMVQGGRLSEPAANGLTESINSHGITSNRMKTGTPLRIDARSVHFEELEEQESENDYHRFSFWTEKKAFAKLNCWLCNTNAEVHKVLNKGLKDSPLYNGQIQSIGPRYCPSIETKLHTFPDRTQHPLFLEPEGRNTNQLYLNGFSSSLPLDIQLEGLRKIPAFRDANIFRPGYAIEYDYFEPTQLYHTLESKIIEGLYFAGQVNGTTGYEEAAGQGIVAGINAALKCGGGSNTFTMKRDESYIGVLIDDLVTKGVDEPYRMFTSRAEYRILLRQDNADVRLTPYGESFGLIGKEQSEMFYKKTVLINQIIKTCENTSIKPKDINGYLSLLNSTPLVYGCKMVDLIGRPEIHLKELAETYPKFDKNLKATILTDKEIIETAEITMKYSGYIEREKLLAEKMRRLEDIKIRGHFNYLELQQLSTEARQKLVKINPETLAQASRIPGISPSDINVLLVLLHR